MATKARIVTTCQGVNHNWTQEENREAMFGILDRAMKIKPDLVCLPEGFGTVGRDNKTPEEKSETISGPIIEATARRARDNRCYVICPLRTMRDGKMWNSAVVIDRAGDILGVYDKAQVVTDRPDYSQFEGGATPGPLDVPVFDLDFARIGIQVCFDIGFPETWAELARKGAQVAFWPSAYNGGFRLQCYANLHRYYVISSVRSDSARIIDPLGQILHKTDMRSKIVWRDINFDNMVCHYDFNYGIPRRIMEAYGDRVEIRSDHDSNNFLVEPLDRTVTVARLQEEFGFESSAQYHNRHSEAFPLLREGREALPQRAHHGERKQYQD